MSPTKPTTIWGKLANLETVHNIILSSSRTEFLIYQEEIRMAPKGPFKMERIPFSSASHQIHGRIGLTVHQRLILRPPDRIHSHSFSHFHLILCSQWPSTLVNYKYGICAPNYLCFSFAKIRITSSNSSVLFSTGSRIPRNQWTISSASIFKPSWDVRFAKQQE